MPKILYKTDIHRFDFHTYLIPYRQLHCLLQFLFIFRPLNLYHFLMMWNFDEPAKREGTNCIKYDLREETFGKKDIIPMWVADMDFKTPDFVNQHSGIGLNTKSLAIPSVHPNTIHQ